LGLGSTDFTTLKKNEWLITETNEIKLKKNQDKEKQERRKFSKIPRLKCQY
jgi:hypothetical protein